MRSGRGSRPSGAIFPPFPFPPSAASGSGPVTSPGAGGSDVSGIPPPARSPFCVCGVCVVCVVRLRAPRACISPPGPTTFFFLSPPLFREG